MEPCSRGGSGAAIASKVHTVAGTKLSWRERWGGARCRECTAIAREVYTVAGTKLSRRKRRGGGRRNGCTAIARDGARRGGCTAIASKVRTVAGTKLSCRRPRPVPVPICPSTVMTFELRSRIQRSVVRNFVLAGCGTPLAVDCGAPFVRRFLIPSTFATAWALAPAMCAPSLAAVGSTPPLFCNCGAADVVSTRCDNAVTNCNNSSRDVHC